MKKLLWVCTKENDFFFGFGSSSACFFLLGFAFSSPVDKSSKQGLVRVLGNQILTCDSKRLSGWQDKPYEMKQNGLI